MYSDVIDSISTFIETARVVSIISAIFYVVCVIIACIKLKESASDKGYSLLPGETANVSIAVKCFFFGIPYMIAAASLPDKKARDTLTVPENTTERPENMDVIMQDNAERVVTPNEWRCEKCGNINSFYTATCSCGEQKPRRR